MSIDYAALTRAKTQDEPFVKKALEEEGYLVESASHSEDYNHIDLKVLDTNGQWICVDVKRNDPFNRKSPNIALTVSSDLNYSFPFTAGNLFAFIDELDNSIIYIDQQAVSDLINKNQYGLFMSRRDHSHYRLIPKSHLIAAGGRRYKPSEETQQLLK